MFVDKKKQRAIEIVESLCDSLALLNPETKTENSAIALQAINEYRSLILKWLNGESMNDADTKLVDKEKHVLYPATIFTDMMRSLLVLSPNAVREDGSLHVSQYKFLQEPAMNLVNVIDTLDLYSNTVGNYNATICGNSGTGKTRIVSATIKDALKNGDLVFVLDVDSQYRNLCTEYNGKYINLASMPQINPFIINDKCIDPEGYADIVVELLSCILGIEENIPFSNRIAIKSNLRVAVINLFNNSSCKSPIDIYNELKEMQSTHAFNPFTELIKDNELFDLLSASTTLGDVNTNENRLIVFDLEQLDIADKKIQLYVYALLVGIMSTIMSSNKSQRKHVVIDGIWSIFTCNNSNREINFNLYGFENFIETFSRKLRMLNGSFIAVSQSIQDFTCCNLGKTFLNQSDYKLFFAHSNIQDSFNDYCNVDSIANLHTKVQNGIVYQEGLFLTPKNVMEEKVEKIYFPLRKESSPHHFD